MRMNQSNRVAFYSSTTSRGNWLKFNLNETRLTTLWQRHGARKWMALPKCSMCTCRQRLSGDRAGSCYGKRKIRQHGDSIYARVIKSQVSLAARRQLCIPIWRRRDALVGCERKNRASLIRDGFQNSRLPYSYQILALNVTCLSPTSDKSCEDKRTKNARNSIHLINHFFEIYNLIEIFISCSLIVK